MGNLLSLILGLLNALVLLIQSIRDQKQREAGREEVKSKQKETDDKAAKDAAEIDALVRSTGIDELRDRMRQYRRPSSDT